MFTKRKLPPEFLGLLKSLEKSYLTETDPIRQSGFGGGRIRWQAERKPILEAVDRDGDFLDVGCANGFLLECLMSWTAGRGLKILPWGLDCGKELIKLARKRFPEYKSHFYSGNAWDWIPPRKFHYVYTLYDCVPPDFLEEYTRRLLERMVKSGGRLILGAYGNRSEKKAPFNLHRYLSAKGFKITGSAEGGIPPITSFVWLNKEK